MFIDVSSAEPSQAQATYCLLSEKARSTSLNASGEEIMYEISVDLTLIPSDFLLSVRLDAILSVSSTSTGTYRVYIGATSPGSTSGATQILQVQTTSTSEVVVYGTGTPFMNPTGRKLLQVTAINNTPASCVSYIRGATVRLV
jgi:hypothetical protein